MSFSPTIETATRPSAVANDNTTPAIGNLSLSAMPSTGALAGTTATEAALVHGESWYQLEKNVTENILQNYKITVTLDEIHKILTNLQHRVNGTTNDTRVGVHNQTNIAPRNDEFLHTRTEIHHQKENRIQLTEDQNVAEKIFDNVTEHTVREWYKMSLTGPEIAINPVFAFEFKAIAASYKVIAAESSHLECELKELRTAIALVASEIVPVKAKAAVSHLKAIAANLNAGIAANGDSPFG